jgi:hypothetical protein
MEEVRQPKADENRTDDDGDISYGVVPPARLINSVNDLGILACASRRVAGMTDDRINRDLPGSGPPNSIIQSQENGWPASSH